LILGELKLESRWLKVCVAAVGKVIEIKGTTAICSFRGAMKETSIVLVPKVEIGQFVVVHAGFATEIVKDLQDFYRSTVATDAYSRQLLDAIEVKSNELQGRPIRIMNFCGSHEHTIHQYGIRDLLPNNIELISGPGCPVCVTPVNEIHLALELCKKQDVILTVFGDLLTIPTPWGTLEQLKSEGADIRLVHDINQSLQLARQVKQQVVHFAAGFETTAPSTGAVIIEAAGLENFSIISSHRLTLPAMDYVLSKSSIDAVICPGNVAMVTGYQPFDTACKKYGVPLIITGFEPIDVLEAVLMIVGQVRENTSALENQYSRVVSPVGNRTAQEILDQVFKKENAPWRGLPILPDSRLVLKDRYEKFNAESKFGLKNHQAVTESKEACCCGEILRGEKQPTNCPSFGTECTPEKPKGPCMISAEGACKIRFNGYQW